MSSIYIIDKFVVAAERKAINEALKEAGLERLSVKANIRSKNTTIVHVIGLRKNKYKISQEQKQVIYAYLEKKAYFNFNFTPFDRNMPCNLYNDIGFTIPAK